MSSRTATTANYALVSRPRQGFGTAAGLVILVAILVTGGRLGLAMAGEIVYG